jgi:hypothetical protein
MYPNQMDAIILLADLLYYVLWLYYLYHWSYYSPTPRFRAASAARKRGDTRNTANQQEL